MTTTPIRAREAAWEGMQALPIETRSRVHASDIDTLADYLRNPDFTRAQFADSEAYAYLRRDLALSASEAGYVLDRAGRELEA